MDYFKLMDNLLSETRQFKQYKRLSMIQRILLIVCMLPVMFVGLGIFVFYEILAFIHKGLATPTAVLKNYVKQERGEIQHLTQAVFYFITQPWIFACEVLLSFISFIFYFVWFFFMVATYLATLGGIRWQPFITEAKFDDYGNYTYDPSDAMVTAYTASTAISMFIWAVTYLCLCNEYSQSLYTFYTIFVIIYLILVCIVNPLIFKKTPILSSKTTKIADTEHNKAAAPAEPVENTSLNVEQAAPVTENKETSAIGSKAVDNTMFRCSACDKWINSTICPYCGTHNNKK